MIRKILRGRRGATLVEMSVTFALTGLFFAAVVSLITGTMNLFSRTVSRAEAQTVSETLMEKIAGEISGATLTAEQNLIIISNGTAGDGVLPFAAKTCISFHNKEGSPVYITSYRETEGDTASPGRIKIHYRPILMADMVTKLDAVDWKFDPAVYKNYSVENLDFENVKTMDGKKTNLIKISLNLENKATGYVYNNEEYVECYNFKKENIPKIVDGGIPVDPDLGNPPS